MSSLQEAVVPPGREVGVDGDYEVGAGREALGHRLEKALDEELEELSGGLVLGLEEELVATAEDAAADEAFHNAEIVIVGPAQVR